MRTAPLLPIVRHTMNSPALRSAQLVRWQARFKWIYDSPYTIRLLLGLGIVRAVFFLLAYPPAHGADSTDYFLYAAQYQHRSVPLVLDAIYPLYPLLIYLTYYVLGSIYILIGFQLVFSTLQAVLFYVGLRPYSAALGFLVALMVIGDAQTGILFNFTSTEPLYMFLLGATFGLFLIQTKHTTSRRERAPDFLLGVLMTLLLLTRPVGRYLIIPMGILFLFTTRSWWRTVTVLAGFGAVLLVFTLFNWAVLKEPKTKAGSNVMIAAAVYRSGLLEAENGSASARLIELSSVCPYTIAEGNQRTRCLIEQTGSWATTQRLYTTAYRELIWSHPIAYARQVFRAFNDFLKLSGRQYYGKLPSDVQCADIETGTARDTQYYLQNDWMFASQTQLNEDQLATIIHDIRTAMCPPLPHNNRIHRITDWVAFHYRSLSRPHPFWWYGVLAVAILLIPWARRLTVPALAAGAILANHAALSALVLNIQPRYVAVINPYRGILLLIPLYIVGLFVIRLVDEWFAQHAVAPQAPSKE